MRFKVVPFDNYPGVSDSTANFHLDNWHLHTVSVDDISGEQSGHVQIDYLISDNTGDEINLVFYYSADSSLSWVFIDSVFGIGEGGYDGSYIWDSEARLSGEDISDLRLSVVSTDGWQIGGSDTILMHIDNETGPLLIYYNSQISPLPDNPFILVFDRGLDTNSIFENINLYSVTYDSIFGNLSFSFSPFEDTVYVYSQLGIPSKDTLLLQVSNQLMDKNGKGFDGNQDGDPQYTIVDDSTLQILSYLVSDFDESDSINVLDLSLFITGWRINDYRFETGPADGVMPHLVTLPDNRYDIEDLMTFIRYWNWANNSGNISYVVEGLMDDQNLLTDWDGKHLKIGISNPDNRISGIHFQIKYPAENIMFRENKLVNLQDFASEDILMFTHIDTANSTNDYILGFIEDYPTDSDSPLMLSIAGSNLDKNEMGIEITYEYFIENDKYTGRKVVNIIPIPTRFTLHQNYPNPFNPLTTIEYDLPEDGNVSLIIYDILGRQIIVLTDEFQAAGYKSIRWNGRNKSGQLVSAGMYFYAIEAGKDSAIRKMVLLK